MCILLFPNHRHQQSANRTLLDLLKKELAMYAKTKYVKTSVFDEIVLGGGTPSVLTAEQMIDLIDFCKAQLHHKQRILHQSHRLLQDVGA